MLACLLIENFNDRFGEVKEILAPFAPKLEIANENAIYMDLEVCEMTDEANILIQNIFHVLKKSSIEVRVGIAPSRFVSFVAAYQAEAGASQLIPSEQIKSFLAGQSISLLPIQPENLRRLKLLGLRTLGQVASLDIPDLINQFENEGRRMSELAQGIDQTPLTPYRQPIDCGEDRGQINVWGDEANASAHSKPRAVAIVSSESGFPQAIFVDGQRIVLDGIIVLWKLESK